MLFLIAFFMLFSTKSDGAQVYSELSQRCCAGSVVNLPELGNPQDYSCCGPDVFEWPRFHINQAPSDLVSQCCEDKLYHNVSAMAVCCGTELYELANQTCYRWGNNNEGAAVLPLSQENIQKGFYFVCGKTREEGSYYDVLLNVCCSGQLYKLKEGMECCGDEYINKTIAKCCHDYVREEGSRRIKDVTSVVHHNGVLPKSPKCCNGSLINAQNQECCKGAVTDLPRDYNWSSVPVCCGSQLILDTRSLGCVNDTEVVRIVPHSPYQVFCGGQLHQLNDSPANVYCVNRTLVQMKRNEFMCRINDTYKKFNYDVQVCAFNELIALSEEDRLNKRLNVCYKTAVEDSTIEWPHAVI